MESARVHLSLLILDPGKYPLSGWWLLFRLVSCPTKVLQTRDHRSLKYFTFEFEINKITNSFLTNLKNQQNTLENSLNLC